VFALARRQLLNLGASQSLWEATALPWTGLDPLRGEARVDVAIVGGGITGLSTAIHLAEAGAKVALLEAESVAYGASGRNGGQVIPGLKLDPHELVHSYGREVAEPLIEFAGNTADQVFGLIARHQIRCDAVRHGWVQAAHDAAMLRQVRARAQQWSERGAPVDLLDADQLTVLSGALGYRGGWIDRRGGRLQPLDYTRGLAAAARALGATLYEHSRVRELTPRVGGWRLTAAEGTLDAEKVVLCMNAYALMPGGWSTLSRAYIPVGSFQIASEPLDASTLSTLLQGNVAVSDTHPLLHYFRLDAAGRLLMGGPGITFRALHSPRQVMPLLEWVERVFPQLREVYRPQCYWGGYVARTLDHLPHLHDLSSGVYAFYGCNGRGVALATAAGAWLARLALGARASEVPLPLTPLRPVPLHAGYPLYIQAARLYYTLKERFKRPPPVLPRAVPAG
jgi:glycine/D-amino acid oxidase-like deaminating enzyme